MALANDEAELAGVLGHEVGHVTARHSAQRYDQAKIGQLGALAGQLGGMLLGGYLGGAAGCPARWPVSGSGHSLGAQAGVQSYSRDQEFEADELGIRDPACSRLRAGGDGQLPRTSQADDAYRQRTRTAAPTRRAFWAIGSAPIRARPSASHARSRPPLPRCRRPGVDRDALLDAIDGMMWG